MSQIQTGNGNGNGQIVPFKQKVETFRSVLDKMKGQLSTALPKHVKVDRLVRIVLTSVQKTPELLDCTRESLLGCIVQAAQLGLEPDGLLGQAYLIPYKDNRKRIVVCTLIVGYKGLLKLARQSGEIASISAHVVHARDDFDFTYGLTETLVHRPARPNVAQVTDEETGETFEAADPNWHPGPIIAAYAVAVLKDGTRQFEVMNRHEIDRIRDGKNSGPWRDHFPEMAKKTVLRRLCKMLPASVELATAVAIDERGEAGVEQEMDDIIDIQAIDGPPKESTPAPSKLDALAAKARGARASAPPRGQQQEPAGPPPLETDDPMPAWAEDSARNPGEEG